jgi:hypothetical protein
MLPLFPAAFRPHIYSRWIAFWDSSLAPGSKTFVMLFVIIDKGHGLAGEML